MIGSIHGKAFEIKNPASYRLSVLAFRTSNSASPFAFRRGFLYPVLKPWDHPAPAEHLLRPPLGDLGQFLNTEIIDRSKLSARKVEVDDRFITPGREILKTVPVLPGRTLLRRRTLPR